MAEFCCYFSIIMYINRLVEGKHMAVRKIRTGWFSGARFFYEAIASDYKDTSELVAFAT